MIEEVVAFFNNNRALLVACFGDDLDYSSSLNSDSDQDSDSGKKNDNNSLGTMATGVSNATRNISEEWIKAGTIDCVDNSTYVSGLTDITSFASPTAKSPPGQGD